MVFPGDAPQRLENKPKTGPTLNNEGLYTIKCSFQRSDLDADSQKTREFRPLLVRRYSARVSFVKGLLAFYLGAVGAAQVADQDPVTVQGQAAMTPRDPGRANPD